MSIAEEKLTHLPATTQKRLTELTSALQGALGEDLVALIVFGSAVRGGFREGQSDVDLLVVVKDDAREKLEAISNAMQLARYAARIEAVILTAEEIPRAADVFPLFYEDIKRCHIALVGKDPFAALEIARKHLRLRIEQELREAQIRLRRAVVDAAGARPAIVGAVHRKLRQLRSPLHALLRLHKSESKDDLASVLTAAESLYKLDLAPLRAVEKDTEKAYVALTKLLHAAIDDIDRQGEES